MLINTEYLHFHMPRAEWDDNTSRCDEADHITRPLTVKANLGGQEQRRRSGCRCALGFWMFGDLRWILRKLLELADFR
jgi:hypothetical protein